MTNREFLETKIKHYNGNVRVIGEIAGTKFEVVGEGPGLLEDEFMDVHTGARFKRTEFDSFENCDFHYGKKRTLNHEARNQYGYVTSGKNHKEDKGELAHLIK
ncbi:MAG: hypothetical protein SFU98_06735 [Leptospiraceae bacterium]|nr:hypothetical protein [Leptospiraceae bacterium]